MNISGYNFEGPYDPYRDFTNTISLDVGQTDDLNNRFPNHPRQNYWESNKIGINIIHPVVTDRRGFNK